QLALAASLIAGRGTGENRQEAAHWMRLAADGVERTGAPTLQARPSAPASSIILTRSNAVMNPGKSTTQTSATSDSGKNLFTFGDSHSTRTTREDNLSAVDPKLQERRVGVQPEAAPK